MELYLDFVEERHRVWWRRQAGASGPWSDDPILASRKFTNVFRILDPGSQFVLTDLVEEGLSEQDTLLRLFLYRHTGRVEAWRALLSDLGEYPTADNLQDVLEAWRAYRGAGVTKLKNTKPYAERANRAGGFQSTTYARPMFTGAYLVFPQSQVPGTDKLESIVDLVDRLFVQGTLAEDFIRAETQAEKFAVLRRNKGVADFMAMQILTDWGYTPFGTNDEQQFVVPGPGARKGVQAIYTGADQVGFMRFAQAEVWAGNACPTINLDDKGSVRYPSIMDVQNTLCEFSKYVRFMEAGKVGSPYTPAHPGPQAAPILPAHWA